MKDVLHSLLIGLFAICTLLGIAYFIYNYTIVLLWGLLAFAVVGFAITLGDFLKRDILNIPRNMR